MYIDNKEFYPTPKILIEKMLFKIKNINKVKYILEPSAGKGDIIKEVKIYFKYNYRKVNIDAIELDKNLQTFLKGLEIPIIHDDFLTFDTLMKYDVIIMNPPFKNGELHLLKAIEIQSRYGGQIICILNANTLENPYCQKRLELINKLKELNADIEYIENAFSNAERKTDVKIALIHLNISAKEKESCILQDLKNDKDYTALNLDNDINNPLINKDLVEYYPALYHNEILLGIKLIKEFQNLRKYILSEENKYTSQNLQLMLNKKEITINDYIQEVRYKYWKKIFLSELFEKIFSNDLRSEYLSNLYEMKNYDVTAYNITTLRFEIISKLKNSLENSILKMFDEFSIKYNYSDFSKNIHYYNGWKTNKAYKINNKIILPYNAFRNYSTYSKFSTFNVSSHFLEIEKVFSMFNGNILGNYNSIKILQEAEKQQITKNIELKFFKVNFYKKGTCHIIFTNQRLLDKLNIYGSQKKGWLPPSFGKKSYDSMTNEEQKVINNFCGKEKYAEILSNRSNYLVDTNNMLQLE